MFREFPTRKRFVASGLLGSAGVVFARPAFAQSVALKLAHPSNVKATTQQVGERFAAEIARRTNGRIKVDVYAGGQLGTEVNLIQGLQTGIIDFVLHTTGYLESFVPTVQALDLPFLFKDAAVAVKILDGEIGREIAADMLQKNLVHLAWGHYGWRNVQTTSVPVTAPADLRGLKMRIEAGPIEAALFKAVGAVPVVMDVADFYVGLQQKTIDGLALPATSFVANKLYEIVKNFAYTRHAYNAAVFLASKPKFDQFSPDDQRTIRTVGASMAAVWRSLTAENDAANETFCRNQGIKFTNTNYAAFRDAMAPVYAEFKPRYPALLDKILAAGK